MRTQNKIKFIVCLIVISLALFTACENDFPTAINNDSETFSGNVPESAVKPTRLQSTSTAIGTLNYPQNAEVNVRYFNNHNTYNGGNLNFVNGTKLQFLYGALTPPNNLNGNKVEITGSIDYDVVNDELVFTFGPSGCQFQPAAELWLKYDALVGSGVPNLYYIDDLGNYVPQVPDEVNTVQKWLKIYILHFSRYAVAYGR